MQCDGRIDFISHFWGEVTSKVLHDANASEFESYLNQVDGFRRIRVTSADDDGDAICSLTSTGVFVDFTGIAETYAFFQLPTIQISNTAMFILQKKRLGAVHMLMKSSSCLYRIQK